MDMFQLNQIPSDAQIRKYLRRIIFGKNIYCPECKTSHVFADKGRYRCRKCRIRFSLTSHTWLNNMKLPLREFWLLLYCWTIQIPIKQAATLVSRSEVTIYDWYRKFRCHITADEQVLNHLIQLDEAYFGGRQGKALFMAKEVGTRKLAYQLVPTSWVNRETAAWFLEENITPYAKLNTDGSSIYKEIGKWWPVYHVRDIHKKFEFEHTSEIEGMFGVMRTFIRRMYHHVTADKLGELVCEFCYRFSHPEMYGSPHHYLENSLSIVTTS
ncbi:hypothetical protein COY87_01540, partial [Candidatus Roizmanbacteria bacterium CG_4_10_14_0_8_um_filter_33_9]